MGLFKRKNKIPQDEVSNELVEQNTQNEEIDDVKIEVLDSRLITNENLIEITDRDLASEIRDGLISSGIVKDGLKFLKNSEKLYRVDCAGKQLVKSKEIAGAYRGFYREGGKIAGHANLVEAKGGYVAKAISLKAIIVKAVIKICISDINAKLSDTVKGVNYIVAIEESKNIAEFEQITSDLVRIIENQDELLSNEDVRNAEIINLHNLNSKCCTLIGTINNLILRNTGNNTKDYKEFINQVEKANNYVEIQQVMLNTLEYISEMTYILNIEKLSKKNCYHSLYDYTNKSNDVRQKQLEWLNKNIEIQKIDLNDKVRYRIGALGKIADFAKKMTKKEVNKVALSAKELDLINTNIICCNDAKIDDKVLFDERIQFILKNDKVYLLNHISNQ